VRLVREEIFEERSASARGMFLQATFEHMARGATIHTTAETQRITALEVSERVGRKARRRGRNSRLVALHGLLHWRHKRMGEGGDVIRMLQGNRERSRGKASSISRMDRGSDRRGGKEGNGQGGRDVCQFSVNGASNQLLVGLLKGIVTNGGVAE
jgi:hypothetical protein